MSDDMKPHSEAPASTALPRIADALGLPVSFFYANRGDVLPAGDRVKLNADAVLALVEAYLQASDPAARRHFVQAVVALADGA